MEAPIIDADAPVHTLQHARLSHQSGIDTDPFFWGCFCLRPESSGAGICILTGLSVLTELSYDMLVANRTRETYVYTAGVRLAQQPCVYSAQHFQGTSASLECLWLHIQSGHLFL